MYGIHGEYTSLWFNGMLLHLVIFFLSSRQCSKETVIKSLVCVTADDQLAL